MSFDAIRQAVEGRMATWGEYPVEYEGTATPPPVSAAQNAKTPWCRLTIRDGDSFVAGLGSDPWVRNTGTIFIQIFIGANTGTATARQVADSLSEHFRFYRTGYLETLTPSYNPIGEDDGYYMANLTVPFRWG